MLFYGYSIEDRHAATVPQSRSQRTKLACECLGMSKSTWRRMQRNVAAMKRSNVPEEPPRHQGTHENHGDHGDLERGRDEASDSEAGYRRPCGRQEDYAEVHVLRLPMPKPNRSMMPPKPAYKRLFPIEIRCGDLWLVVGSGHAPYDEATTLHV
jgi:hypothetical protein